MTVDGLTTTSEPTIPELLLGYGVGGPNDDVLIAAAVTDRRDGGLAGLDIRREDENDIPVGDDLRDIGIADVLDLSVEILIPQGLDTAFVLVEDEHVVALVVQLFGDRVADAATAKNRIGRS